MLGPDRTIFTKENQSDKKSPAWFPQMSWGIASTVRKFQPFDHEEGAIGSPGGGFLFRQLNCAFGYNDE
jgi:hypothetical protein